MDFKTRMYTRTERAILRIERKVPKIKMVMREAITTKGMCTKGNTNIISMGIKEAVVQDTNEI